MKRKIRGAFLWGAICLTTSAAFATAVPAGCTAVAIEPNSTVGGRFSTTDCGDGSFVSDYYRFSALAGTKVTISASSAMSGFIALSLSTDAGLTLRSDLNSRPQIQYVIPNDDFYVIRVSTSDLISDPYSLTLTATKVVNGCGSDDPATLCLDAGRFRIQTAWNAVHLGTQGAGTAIAMTDDTGYFWFFTSDNVELVIKILDGRAINGHFWVFYGALSNVAYTITITDTQTGAVKTYSSPQDTQASVSDTSAF